MSCIISGDIPSTTWKYFELLRQEFRITSYVVAWWFLRLKVSTSKSLQWLLCNFLVRNWSSLSLNYILCRSEDIFSFYSTHCVASYSIRTFVCKSLSVVMQYLYLWNAECKCLNPPIKHAAGLSAEMLISVPFICFSWPLTLNVTPLSYGCYVPPCSIVIVLLVMFYLYKKVKIIHKRF